MKPLIASLPFLIAVRVFPWMLGMACLRASRQLRRTIWRGGGSL